MQVLLEQLKSQERIPARGTQKRASRAKYTKILVTGPQRSGTTIVAHIIAKELGYKYYDERDIGVRSATALFGVLSKKEKLVIQGPCFCSLIHLIDSPNTAIVLMKRNIDDIRASEERINWEYEKEQLANYFREDGIISQVRYDCWEKYQKPKMAIPYFEFDYERASSHPMWLPKEKRLNLRREIA